jgi:hypothetical protein
MFTDIPFNDQEIIQYLKYSCPAHLYATSMSPPAVQQVISAIKVVLGEDGSSRGKLPIPCVRTICISSIIDGKRGGRYIFSDISIEQ